MPGFAEAVCTLPLTPTDARRR